MVRSDNFFPTLVSLRINWFSFSFSRSNFSYLSLAYSLAKSSSSESSRSLTNEFFLDNECGSLIKGSLLFLSIGTPN